ncbi:exodeoxyribonuclease V subunit beta [Vibrio sp. D431a]|uniref:exodeoxyribonuclease V subunit beta n=1 Tax=Vibrio sp. D431a TaxID=2837388 RepID=UPI002553B5D9|nr:exodeoxyribonuclease V subunit beta [Vibrio sp. D431a]MDK9793293.1 exodeoxyribonuclease V subunit beta [Vibrio sp. D431a]
MIAKELNALDVSLHGSKLIEASAGTGKTYTIATLYLRLLLGHKSSKNCVHSTPLSVDQILVVTFTEAATEELRDRIRKRIREARIAFMRGFSSDPTISSILHDTKDIPTAVNVLLRAESQMDEAAIFTIHGFCQRMLTQNAFEAGTLFNSEFKPDESEVRFQVVADFWRGNFYSLPRGLCNEIRKVWSTPHDLLRQVNPFLSGTRVHIKSTATLTDNLVNAHNNNLSRIDSLKKLIRQYTPDEIDELIANSDVCKRSFTKKSRPKYINEVWSWAEETPTSSYDFPSTIEKFTCEFIESKTKKGDPIQHEVFAAISEFLANKPSIKESAFLIAEAQCREALADSKIKEAWMSFDDLLTNLSRALDEDESNVLAHRIRTQFPFAMIDEFQDTDQLQYNIFKKVYQDKMYPEDIDDVETIKTGLFMIGDPKQAIYSFRGADVFTYMTAKRTIDELLTLSKNWRSSHEIVEATNAIFKTNESPFMYNEDIPYTPAVANSKPEEREWFHGGDKQKAMTIWCPESLDKPVSKSSYLNDMAHSTASQVQGLLNGLADETTYLTEKGKKKLFNASDIAILVRTGREAALIQRALIDVGISSVYLSGKESVYTSTEAKDLYRLLNAVLDPKNERSLRGVLASNLFRMGSDEIEALNQSDKDWDETVLEFMNYQTTWKRSGILPMIRQVITSRGIASKIMSEAGGERSLTNLLHIGELLQRESQTIDSEHGLLKFFDESIKAPNGNAEEQQLRLESEQNLVQIITIHKSKGLEYDFVFMPFVCGIRELDTVLFHDPDTNQQTLDITGSKENEKLASKEKLAEDLRLLYVGLTRSVYATFIGMAPVCNGLKKTEPTGLHKTAIGYLIQEGKEYGINDLDLALLKLEKNCEFIKIVTPPNRSKSVSVSVNQETVKVTPKTFKGSIESDWWITSYSHITSNLSGHHGATLDVAAVDPSLFAVKEEEVELNPAKNIYTFARGATAGTFLHAIFEEVEYTKPASEKSNTHIIQELMRLNSIDEEWLPTLQKLVDDVLSCDLDGKGLTLNSVPAEDRLVEMEFLLPIRKFTSAELNPVMKRYEPLWGDFKLDFKTVSGLLKGFIDLTFQHQGKFYVLDWKSNYLGGSPEFYHQEALQESMADHRYDLQCVLYAVALHKFLKSKLQNYNFEDHMGGALYIFLRGIEDGTNNGIYYSLPPKEFVEELEKILFH